VNDNDKVIVVNPKEDLHPKTKRYPFKDKNGNEFKSVAEAFIKATEGMTISVTNAMIILVKIIVAQVMWNRKALGAIFKASMGKKFVLNQKQVDFLPDPKAWGTEGKNLYGVVLQKVRGVLIEMINRAKLEESRGTVPNGCQPCLKCGGEGKQAGSGHWMSVADGSAKGWKYIGPCYDCLPSGGGDRGLGYITRALARKNWTYRTHNPKRWDETHYGIEANLYDPDDNSLWKYVPKCSYCGVEAGQGVPIFVGKGDKPDVCRNCLNDHGGDVNMTVIKVEKEDLPT